MEAKPERLQKILAAAGLASRRKAEELIAAGIVSVNGNIVTEPGTKADPRIDEIRVEGKLLRGPERHVYLAIYKPKGHMTTVSDPEGRPTVMDLLKGVEERVFPVGRLDYMSEGLLLLTNDGDLMAELTKAGSHVAKTYMVKVSGKPTDEALDKLRNGIMLPPEPGLTGVRGKKQPGTERRSFAVLTQPAYIQLAVDQENPWFEVTLTEGRNRQLRRMFEQVGHHIEKIKRVRYGSLTLDLEPGEFRHLTPKEVNQLRKSLETPFKPKPVKVKRKDDRPERRPRVDTARFVKGRRGKPAATAPAATASAPVSSFTPSYNAAPARSASAPGDTPIQRAPTPRPFTPREDRGARTPRGPEFSRDSARRDSGFAAKRTYTPKPSGDFEDRPKRPYVRKSAETFDRKPGKFDPKSDGKRSYTKRPPASREGGYAKREGGLGDAPAKRAGNSGSGTAPGFGFAKFNKPKFVKPSKHRDLGSDKTDGFERKPFSADRPYSKDRGPSADRGFADRGGSDRGFAKKPGAYGDRKFSKGPGKPSGFSPRPGSDFKRPSGDFKPRPSSGEFKRTGSSDFKPSGFKRPSAGRTGSFGKPPRPGGGDFKRSGGGDFKRPAGSRPMGGGGNFKRPGRPTGGPSRGTGAPRPPRRHEGE
jgi:23S rRNA pseudouridine2605 synthase